MCGLLGKSVMGEARRSWKVFWQPLQGKNIIGEPQTPKNGFISCHIFPYIHSILLWNLRLKTRLCEPGVESNLETEFWVKQKRVAFIALPGTRWVGRLMPSELCPSRVGALWLWWEVLQRCFEGRIADKDHQGMQGLPSLIWPQVVSLMSSVWSNCDLLSGLKNASVSYHLPFVRGFSSAEERRDAVMCVSRGGARTEPQGCTIVSWLLLPGLCIPQNPASLLSNSLNLPFELRESHGGWN